MEGKGSTLLLEDEVRKASPSNAREGVGGGSIRGGGGGTVLVFDRGCHASGPYLAVKA